MSVAVVNHSRRTRWVRLGLVAVAGLALGLSWEPYGLWPLALVAVPLLTLSLRGLRPRTAFGHGYLFALVALTVSLSWVHVIAVPVAFALITFMSLWFGLLGILLSHVGRLRLWPLWAACGWVATEFAFSRFPFGGFGWSRLGFTAVDGPLAGWFPVLGVAGVSFLVALTGHLGAWLVLRILALRRARALTPSTVGDGRWAGRTASWRPVAVVAAAVVAIGGTGAVLANTDPVIGAAERGTVDVGIVQGNVPGRGLDAMGRMRSVTNNHLSETLHLMARAHLGQIAAPDFVLWPENSTDIDPRTDPVTHATVESAAEAAGVPILVGAVSYGPEEGQRQTTGMWWMPGVGPTTVYHKQDLVPFGEWIPMRDVLLPLVPMLAMVGAQGVPGTEPGALDVRLADGRALVVGDVICFELAYDDTIRSMVTNGAEVVVVQSNNATYGGTGQIEQQFAITRARAMETRREIAVATTNSVSGHIDRRGVVLQRSEEFTAASMMATMPVRQGLTPAMLIGPWVDLAITVAALLAWGVALVLLRRERRRVGVGTDRPTADPSSEPVSVPDPRATDPVLVGVRHDGPQSESGDTAATSPPPSQREPEH